MTALVRRMARVRTAAAARIVAGDEETAAYVARLEESFDEEASDLGSGDDLIEEVERFLRDQS